GPSDCRLVTSDLSKTGGFCHGRLRHSTARPRHTQVRMYRSNFLAGLGAETAIGGTSLYFLEVATEVQDSVVGRVWQDRRCVRESDLQFCREREDPRGAVQER